MVRINSMSKIEEVLYLLKHKKPQRYIADKLSISRPKPKERFQICNLIAFFSMSLITKTLYFQCYYF